MAYSKASFQLPFGILNISQEPNDLRYGPYTAIGTAVGETFHVDSPMTPGNRFIGLTVGIVTGGMVEDYWFKDGTADGDLIIKTSGGGGGAPLYATSVPLTTITPEDHGGIPAGTTAGSLNGKTFSYMFDEILFPTEFATVGVPTSSSISITPSTTSFEVGEEITYNMTIGFNQGTILDGDGSLNANPLVGADTQYKSYVKGSMDHASASNIIGGTFIIDKGNNEVYGEVTYDPGTGDYYDNKGNIVTNLDSLRAAGTEKSNTKVYKGYYNMYLGQDMPYGTSAELRAMDTKFLGSSDTISNYEYSINLTAPSNHTIAIAIPDGKNLTSVKLKESSNAELIGAFADTGTVAVTLPNGTTKQYRVFVQSLTSGYGTIVTYVITVT